MQLAQMIYVANIWFAVILDSIKAQTERYLTNLQDPTDYTKVCSRRAAGTRCGTCSVDVESIKIFTFTFATQVNPPFSESL